MSSPISIPRLAPRSTLPACAALALSSVAAFGQTSNAPDAAAPSDEVVQLSKFEVSTTRGAGYVSSNTARAFKTNQSLLDIQQDEIVITSYKIAETGYANSSDVLQYVGLTAVYEGEPVSIRGSRDANSYLDDMPNSGIGHDDYVDIDSYEVIKGPAAVLYANSSLSGVVIMSTKKPLPYAQTFVSETVSQWGLSRTTVDANDPIGNIGQISLTFRFNSSFQAGNTYWYNKKENIGSLYPSLQLHYRKTTLRVAYDLEKLLIVPSGFDNLSPNGSLHTAAGRRMEYYPPDGEVNYERIGLRTEFLQQISLDWENRFQAEGYKFNYFGTTFVPQQKLIWPAQTDVYNFLRNEYRDDIWIVMDDVTGHYHLGPIKAQSNFGFLTDDTVAFAESWSTVPGDSNVMPIGGGAAAAFNAIAVPQPQLFSVPANPGTRSKTLIDNIYFQQQLDVIPDRLSLVGGFTWANIETILDTNIAANAPYVATDTTGTAWLHRFGAVLHLTKELALYALNSTSFTPGVGTDYNNNRLPNIAGTGSEVGLKTAFFDGRISSTSFDLSHELHQTRLILAQGQNLANVNYYIPIGSTTSKGVDGELAMVISPGWQMIGTFYVGTVRDQTGNSKISATYDNSWSLFTRYDFAKGRFKDASGGPLRLLALGGGASRIGSTWLTSSGYSGAIAPGYTLPPVIKLHEGLLVNVFVEDNFAKHWSAKLAVVNLLNLAFPVAGQTVDRIDPSPPTTLSLTLTYRF